MSETTNTTETLAPEKSRFNRAAIRRHALKVSNEVRAGKFQRVSEQFLESIEAQVEDFFRRLRAPLPNMPLGQVEPDEGEEFLTGIGKEKLAEAFNVWIARQIHKNANQVRIGKTL